MKIKATIGPLESKSEFITRSPGLLLNRKIDVVGFYRYDSSSSDIRLYRGQELWVKSTISGRFTAGPYTSGTFKGYLLQRPGVIGDTNEGEITITPPRPLKSTLSARGQTETLFEKAIAATNSNPGGSKYPGGTGYLQHGSGSSGPFSTESVPVRIKRLLLGHRFADRWQAHYQGKWRAVHIQDRRTYIVYLGGKITIKIDGV